MNRVLFILLVFFLSWPNLAACAEVRGKIWIKQGKKKLSASHATITFECNGEKISNKTSKHGNYTLHKVPRGSCWASVVSDTQKYTKTKIYIPDEDMRANFELRNKGKHFFTIYK